MTTAPSDTGKRLELYTITYDDSGNETEHTQQITASYRAPFKVTVEWMDAENKDDLRPDSLTVELLRQETDAETDETTLVRVTDEQGEPVTLELKRPDENENVNGVGYWQGSFPDAVQSADTVYAARVVDADSNGDIIRFEGAGVYAVTYDDMELPISSAEDYAQRIVLTAKRELKVQKKWDVDLLQEDVPEELGVILQKKTGTETKDGKTVDTWSDPLERLTLCAVTDWEGTFQPVDRYLVESDTTELKDGQTVRTVKWKDGAEYRVREISEAKLRETLQSYLDGAAAELPQTVKDYIDKHKPVDSVLDWAGEVLDGTDVPEAVKTWTKQYLQDSIPESGEEILLDVPDENGGHKTRYLVTIKTDGDTTTITDQAVLYVTVYKQWMLFGAAKENMPDSVYMMLLARPKQDAATEEIPGASTWLPVHRVSAIPGGTLIDGDCIDIPILGKVIAIGEAKADEDADTDDDDKGFQLWQLTFRVEKYNMYGVEQEYKGAELTAGSISVLLSIV